MGSQFLSAQDTLVIEISGMKSDTGFIMLQLLSENQEVIMQDRGIIEDWKSTIIFNNLQPGKYAVRYYHDENLSGEMETNALGIPQEGYGFSNDAYGMFGPKPFSEWLFEFNSSKKIILKIKY
jgi:uncharacterized protein (DUF2141 family)